MKYICQICGFIYDEAVEKVPFAELPDSWTCPLCGAAKSDFKPEASQTAPQPAAIPLQENNLQELSLGQLAALCSNLARGCEKQYKTEESRLFARLADFFTATVPAAADATVENLTNLLQSDIAAYPALRATADASADRGAARVCVWGEKVTRMLSSLLERYQKEGEPLLANTGVWLCTVCGFVYIGDTAPALCPVCKVPSWKFEKIEGRN